LGTVAGSELLAELSIGVDPEVGGASGLPAVCFLHLGCCVSLPEKAPKCLPQNQTVFSSLAKSWKKVEWV